jgi:hypothetical protein
VKTVKREPGPSQFAKSGNLALASVLATVGTERGDGVAENRHQRAWML